MTAFMAAIPDKVKVALGGATIDYNAILSVDRDWLHCQAGGVYMNLAVDKSTKEYGCYVRSTRRHFHIRLKRHLKIAAQYTPDTLPLSHGGSKHYNYVCKANATSNFRILAVFRDKDVPAGYVYLLEAIMRSCSKLSPRLVTATIGTTTTPTTPTTSSKSCKFPWIKIFLKLLTSLTPLMFLTPLSFLMFPTLL